MQNDPIMLSGIVEAAAILPVTMGMSEVETYVGGYSRALPDT